MSPHRMGGGPAPPATGDARDATVGDTETGPASLELTRAERTAGLLQRNAALAALLLLCAAATVAFPSFSSAENLRNIGVQSSFLALVALGMTFVIINGGIDLSVGSLFALGGVLAAYGSRWGLLGALGMVVLGCGGFGLINGLLVAKARLAPFIVTLATLLAARGLVLEVTNQGQTTYLIPQGSATWTLGNGAILSVGVPVFIAVGGYLVGAVVLQRTRYGQSVFAIGGSEEAATLMGVRVARAKIIVYLVSGLLAGLGGALLAARSSSGVPTVGVGLELNAIAAVVIGGTLLQGGAGSIIGTACGVLVLGVIQNIINQIGSLNANYQQVVSGGFLALVVVVQTYLARTQRL